MTPFTPTIFLARLPHGHRQSRAGVPFENEHRLRRADGAYRWFQARARPLRDSDGRIVRWYMLITDIDDRKRAEDALRASEHDLRSIIDTMPGYVATMGASR